MTPFPISEEIFSQIFSRLDANGDGHITLDEFADAVLARATCVEHCELTLEGLREQSLGNSLAPNTSKATSKMGPRTSS